MAKYLIDSSAWILYFRERGGEKAKEAVSTILARDEGVTAGVIMAEVLAGARTKKGFESLRDELLALEVLPTPEEVWLEVGRAQHELVSQGVTVPVVDMLIARLAERHSCAVVHADRHFEMIRKHRGLETLAVGEKELA